ncbi:MAG: Ig-like domain-containing protein [Puia sp.]
MKIAIPYLAFLLIVIFSCNKNDTPQGPPSSNGTPFNIKSYTVNGVSDGNNYFNLNKSPIIKISFTGGLIDKGSVAGGITFAITGGSAVPATFTYDNDSTLNITPASALSPITGYYTHRCKTIYSPPKIRFCNPV